LDLLTAFETLLACWRSVFPQERTFQRAYRLTFGLIACLRQHLTSAAICTTGRQFLDWTADYRVFSRSPWEPSLLFDAVIDGALPFLAPDPMPIVVALDDTICRKTGRRIPGIGTWRDPQSPKFRINLMGGLRFVQGSLIIAPAQPGPARALPLRFEPAPLPPKPKKKASQDEIDQYKLLRKQHCLSNIGVQLIRSLRDAFDRRDAVRQRPLLITVDGSYTNRAILTQLPDNTILLGRIRKDAKLHRPLAAGFIKKGRRPRYGPAAPTPEQILADSSVPFMPVQCFAAGDRRTFQVKVLDNVFWRKAGSERPLRLIVIKPVGYRLRNGSKLLYRDPAFLICTDLSFSVQTLVQAYVYRWEIECNHRDEKSFIGVAEGQVRNPKAVQRLPQFQVATYSLLLLAALQAYGFRRSDDFLPLPKWRRKSARPSVIDLIDLLRAQLLRRSCSSPPPPNIIEFNLIPPPDANRMKSLQHHRAPAA
jgi:DDE superfamily endonuclease